MNQDEIPPYVHAPQPPPAYFQSQPGMYQIDVGAKPGQVTAIAVLCLISGILDCFGLFTIFALWPAASTV